MLTHVQNLVYPCLIQNTCIFLSQSIFKHFHKSSILDVWYYSERASFLLMLSNFQRNFTVSLTLHFRYYIFKTYSAMVQPYLGRFRHVYNSGLFSPVIFHAYREIFGHTRTYFSRFKHIQNHCITAPNSACSTCSSSQVVLHLNHYWNLFGRFFHFCFKSKYSTYFFRDNISITIITIKISSHPLIGQRREHKLVSKPVSQTSKQSLT